MRIGDWARADLLGLLGRVAVSLFAGAAAMRARYKAGDELLRRQVLWLAYGALLIPVWLGGTSLLGPHRVLDATRPTP